MTKNYISLILMIRKSIAKKNENSNFNSTQLCSNLKCALNWNPWCQQQFDVRYHDAHISGFWQISKFVYLHLHYELHAQWLPLQRRVLSRIIRSCITAWMRSILGTSSELFCTGPQQRSPDCSSAINFHLLHRSFAISALHSGIGRLPVMWCLDFFASVYSLAEIIPFNHDCVVTFGKDLKNIGWRCQPKRRQISSWNWMEIV